MKICDIPCVILCGGKGTRLRDVSEILPKPMVSIGEFPIVLHIMKWYMKFGVKNFILCLGYKKEKFIDYFLKINEYSNDIKIDFANKSVSFLSQNFIDCSVTLADTGEDALTGDRIKSVMKYVLPFSRFFLTYGDGLSNVDIDKLLSSHISSGKKLTISKVKNPTRFGIIHVDNNDNITDFNEKKYTESYINGGFMVVETDFVDYYVGNNQFFEQEPICNAIQHNDVHAFTHNGFWQCMDNLKDYSLLNDIWKSGDAPWKA